MNIQTGAFQISIFVPWVSPFGDENWIEQILGEIVLPLANEHSSQIEAIWITRYADSMSRESHEGLQQQFLRRGQNGEDYWRHAKLRFLVRGDADSLRMRSEELIQAAGCVAPLGWKSYDYVLDLGSDRFIRPQATPDEREQRANLVFRFIDATTRLMLASIQKNNQGQWHLEPNEHELNPEKSFFQSIHHLFCNATEVPTFVEVVVSSSLAAIRARLPVKF